jgi:putative transposase
MGLISERFYRRRLPHWQPDAGIFFVTFRLFGSLPAEALERIKAERRVLLQEARMPGESPRDRALRTSMRLFHLAEGCLDTALSHTAVPFPLENPDVARIVCQEIRSEDDRRYQLHRYVVMPNHVHLLMRPRSPDGSGRPPLLSAILGRVKGRSARDANELLRRSGTFWQDESYDHCVRDADEYARLVEYIDHNPVKAALCERPELWPWGSAGEGADHPPI